MKIYKPNIYQNGSQIEYRASIESESGSTNLWFSLDEEYQDFVSDSCNAALVALLIPAMAKGEDIEIEGAISERLFYTLSRSYQSVLKAVIPSLRTIHIHPKELTSQLHRMNGVATGFSAGIDSYCVLADHYFSKDIQPGFKVTHLLFNNVGSHGAGGERLFNQRYEKLKPVAERLNLPFIKINSNIDEFYGKGLEFQQTHTPRNASVAHLLNGRIGRWLYASTYDYPNIFVGETNSTAYSDPVAIPLLASEEMDMLSVGSEYTRVQKTLRVAEIPDSYDHLNVCVRDFENCSVCWKCMRTLLTLDIAGVIHRYSASFDLDKYHKEKEAYLAMALHSHEPLLHEIIQFAAAQNYPLPSKPSTYRSLSHRVIKKTPKLIGRFFQKVKRIMFE